MSAPKLVMQAGAEGSGLSEDQIETVAWLVRHHLLFSTTAFRRDLDDAEDRRRFRRA